MNETNPAPLELSSAELEVLAELLESERAKLLVEIRHTDHRSYRTELRERLETVERVALQVRMANRSTEQDERSMSAGGTL